MEIPSPRQRKIKFGILLNIHSNSTYESKYQAVPGLNYGSIMRVLKIIHKYYLGSMVVTYAHYYLLVDYGTSLHTYSYPYKIWCTTRSLRDSKAYPMVVAYPYPTSTAIATYS